MAADEKDDPGVLGNLPRSRPGRRSDKRAGGASASKRPAASRTSTQARAKPAAKKSATPKTTAPKAVAEPARARRPEPKPEPEPAPQRRESGGGDPLQQAVRLAGKVAETGVKAAVGIIKRLPGAR